MNVVDCYMRRHDGLVILILGLCVEESNHHGMAERLCIDLNNSRNNMYFTHEKVGRNDAFDYSKITDSRNNGLVISSDVIPAYRDMFDVVIFVDTPLRILEERGLRRVVDIEMWDMLKKSYKITRFVNDTVVQRLNVRKAYENKTYNHLWTVLMDSLTGMVDQVK